MEDATPEEIITWAVGKYHPRLTMATAFGPEDAVILHMLAEIEPRGLRLQPGYGLSIPGDLELRERIAERYGIEVELKRAEMPVAQYEASHGGPLYKTNPDQCCFDRKVVVLQRAAGRLCGPG